VVHSATKPTPRSGLGFLEEVPRVAVVVATAARRRTSRSRDAGPLLPPMGVRLSPSEGHPHGDAQPHFVHRRSRQAAPLNVQGTSTRAPSARFCCACYPPSTTYSPRPPSTTTPVTLTVMRALRTRGGFESPRHGSEWLAGSYDSTQCNGSHRCPRAQLSPRSPAQRQAACACPHPDAKDARRPA